MSGRAHLAGVVLLLAGCLPRAWDDERPAGTFVGTVGTVPRRDGGFGGGPVFGGGMGGMGFGGGFSGGTGGGMGFGGGVPMGGGGPRPLVPEVTGSFTGGMQALTFPRGALRSTTLAAIPGSRRLVVVVDDADALFVLQTPNRRIPLPAGARPSSVAVSPDGSTAWVALRGLGALARVTLGTGAVVTVPVGAEPTGVALSPSGRTAVVATFGERTVTLVDTATLAFTVVDVGGNPRALTISDDGDGDDADESAFITLFFGELLTEGSDTGLRGVVVELNLGTQAVARRITLVPLVTSGPNHCSPNQLTAIAQEGGYLYVTHVCASPAAPQGPMDLVRAGLSVIDLSTRSEAVARSRVLFADVFGPSLMANPVDVAPFFGRVIVLSQGANALQIPEDPMGLRVGLLPFYMPGMGPQGEDPAAGVPTGLLAVSTMTSFIVDSTGRRVLEVVPAPSALPVTAWPFETLPPEGSAAYVERLGRRHFATAEGSWSSQRSGSCESCHPNGLTDGLTWVFSAGPRQTPSLAGTFARGRLAAHRAQGWTATTDELADVEGVIRSLCGGTGAITLDGGFPVPLATGFPGPGGVARHDGLSASSRELVASTGRRDWLELEAWVAALPRPPASARLDVLAVARGRQLFASGGCDRCHGGPQWTVSRVPYVPSFTRNGSAVGDDGVPAVATGLRTQTRASATLWNPSLNTDTLKVAPESVIINSVPVTIGPERITCVLRDVGTFDRSDPFEVKTNGQPAQGERGFNPPSLIGLATSAPYLHHGRARTLTELFSAPWARHHQAATPAFLGTGDGGVDADQVSDLVGFLQSIDETTVPFPVPPGVDVCAGY